MKNYEEETITMFEDLKLILQEDRKNDVKNEIIYEKISSLLDKMLVFLKDGGSSDSKFFQDMSTIIDEEVCKLEAEGIFN